MNYKKITANDLYPALKLDTNKHLLESRILASRNEQLKYIKKNSICMEIGVFKGDFSQKILDICKPSKLYLIEINTEYCNELKIKFPDRKTIHGKLIEKLRYGENPHQEASLYGDLNNFELKKINGKKLY